MGSNDGTGVGVTRRAFIVAGAGLAATPGLAEACRLGPPVHEKGPPVFLDYDQVELDAAYDQGAYQPHGEQVLQRLADLSSQTRRRLGNPTRAAYGPGMFESLDIYRTSRADAPIFVFIHGGTWRFQNASNYAYPAEMFVDAGAHYVAIDFASVMSVGGDLGVLASQVRSAIAWVHANAADFGGDPDRLFIGGHSSGGHLCAVALVTDWERDFGLPADTVKGGLCISGMYDMAPVRLSWRSSYLAFTDAMEDAMSPQRHIDRLNAPVVVACGMLETPEFQRQGRDFAAAVKAAGKPVELIEALGYFHEDMAECLGNPYGPCGRAALALMAIG
jgi:arylformamidase